MYTLSDSSDEDERRGDVDMLVDHSDDDDSSDAEEPSDEEETTLCASRRKRCNLQRNCMSLNDLDYENVRLVDPATGLFC